MARNHFVLLALAAVGPALISSGCNSGGNAVSGTGGTPGSGRVSSGGSTGSGGAGPSCPNVTACGGGVGGTRAGAASCLEGRGKLDPSLGWAGWSAPPITRGLPVSGNR